MSKKQALDISDLKKSYDAVSILAEKYLKEIRGQLKEIIDKKVLKLGFPIQGRVKSWPSITEKVISQNLALKTIEDLQDLIGLRAVFLYKRDLKLVEEAINKTFVVKKQYDTFDRLAENQFGYSSIHFIIELPKSWLTVPSFSEFGKFRAEIQIRTIAQHIWSEVSHELQYKRKIDVPTNLIRPIYRASALLETVDLEFERLLVERESYIKKISIDNEQELNVDNIEKILDEILPRQNKDHLEEYSELHKELLKAGIKKTSELRKLLMDNIEWLIEYDKSRVISEIEEAEELETINLPPDEWKRVKKGYYFTHIGLVRGLLNRKKEN